MPVKEIATTRIEIEKKLLPLQPFVIPVKGLKAGRSDFEWHADGTFFDEYGNPDIIGADVNIAVEVENGEFSVEVKCSISGSVTVRCDLCLGSLVLPVETSFEEEDVFDLNQDVYDYVCMSLPIRKVHPDGECDEETVKYLSK